MGAYKDRVKFAIIGAGSVSFCPATTADILLSEPFARVDNLEIFLMDVRERALEASKAYCAQMAARLGRSNAQIRASTDLAEAVDGADFVVTAVEADRYKYWSMDYHIPRRYGFRQIYGENGGPGGMFHALRNMPLLVNIAHAMERGCPGAWMLNYSNPEAKLVEAISKLTGIKAVGLCHGEQMGMDQLALFLRVPKERIAASPVGLNHFGWFTRVWDRETGEDLYPRLRELEKAAAPLAHWDEFALSRIMLRTYGLWPYPGANHIGEYIAWSDGFLASSNLQFYFDPASENPWEAGAIPEFVYSLSRNPTDRPMFPESVGGIGDDAARSEYGGASGGGKGAGGKGGGSGGAEGNDAGGDDAAYSSFFDAGARPLKKSGEYGIPIAEAIFFDEPAEIGAVNVPNLGYAGDLPRGMVIELPALADGGGLHPRQCDPLPVAAAAMLSLQGAIHRLVIEAYTEKSRNKLLQATLLDPTVSGYANAVAAINELCELQKDVLPPLYW